MSLSVFLELRFWLLVGFSLVLPVGIYALLLVTRSISRWAVLGFGVALVLIAGVDVYLLQSIAAQAKSTLANRRWGCEGRLARERWRWSRMVSIQ